MLFNSVGISLYFSWQHYFKRYSLHQKSLKCEEKLMDGAIKSKMEDMQAIGKTWNEVRLLNKHKSHHIIFYLEIYLVFIFLGSVLAQSSGNFM